VKAFLDHFEEVVSVVLLAVMGILAFVNVLTRYFIHYSFAFTEEIEVALLVWVTLLGGAAGFKRGLHLGFTYFIRKLPPVWHKAVAALSGGLMLLICALLFHFSLVQIRDEIEMSITTEALGLPQWWYTIAIPVGSVVIAARVIEAACGKLRDKP